MVEVAPALLDECAVVVALILCIFVIIVVGVYAQDVGVAYCVDTKQRSINVVVAVLDIIEDLL